MLEGTKSGCINHPGVEATLRCKQCGKPICDACVVVGATGCFCSPGCKEKHEAFTQRSQALETKARPSLLPKLKRLLTTLIVLVAVLFAAGLVATLVEIPVISPLAWKIRSVIGL